MSYSITVDLNLDDSIVRRLEACRKKKIDLNTLMALTKLYEIYGEVLPTIYLEWLKEQEHKEKLMLEDFMDCVTEYVCNRKPGLPFAEAIKHCVVPWKKLAKEFFETKNLGCYDESADLLTAFFEEYKGQLNFGKEGGAA